MSALVSLLHNNESFCARLRLGALALVALVALVAAAPAPARADAAGDLRQMRTQLADLQKLVAKLEHRVDDQDRLIADMRGGLVENTAAAPAPARTPDQSALEAELARELAGPSATPAFAGGSAAVAPPAVPQPITVGGGNTNFLNLSFDVLVAGGTSTEPDISRLETGGHDPNQRGFTVQNVEMVLEGAVDPYFHGNGNIVLQIDPEGETSIELEEAYLTTTSLPNNLQLKGGQFFSEFGRLNPQHPHTWDFVDQPLVNGRFLGPDGLRGPGIRASWLAPTNFFSEVSLSVQNSQGETGASFRNTPGEQFLGRPVEERQPSSLRDVVWVPRYTASFDLSETQTLVLGLSSAFGDNFTGKSTRLWGMDSFWKWKPDNAEAGFPFVKWQTEVMQRSFSAAQVSADTDGDGIEELFPAENLRDWGGYSQVTWGFMRGWTLGLRGDYVRGNGSLTDPDPTSGSHLRVSPALSWYPTEFSKLRLQLNGDRVQGEGSDLSLWLQMEFILGAHAAHKF